MILIAVAYQKALGEKNMEESTETRLRDYSRKYTEQSHFQTRLVSDLSLDEWRSTVTLPIDLTLSGLRNVEPLHSSDSPQWKTVNLRFSNFDRSVGKNQDDDTSTIVLLKGLYLNKTYSSSTSFVRSVRARSARIISFFFHVSIT